MASTRTRCDTEAPAAMKLRGRRLPGIVPGGEPDQDVGVNGAHAGS